MSISQFYTEASSATLREYWHEYHLKGVATKAITYPHPTTRGYGTLCTQLIPKKTVFISCPYQLVVNRKEILKRSPYRYPEHYPILQQVGHSYLYLIDWVLRQRLANSRPWFEIGSKGLIDFDEQKVLRTKDEALIQKFYSQSNLVNSTFENYFDMVHKQNRVIENVTRQQYLRVFKQVYQLVSSRSFNYDMPEVGMIPIVDCLNHAQEAKNMTQLALVNIHFQDQPQLYDQWIEYIEQKLPYRNITRYQFMKDKIDLSLVRPTSKSFDLSEYQEKVQHNEGDIGFPITHVVVFSHKVIRPNEEILLYYGSKANLDLLINYGFCQYPNINDSMKVYLTKTQVLYRQPRTLCDSVDISFRNFLDLLYTGRRMLSQDYSTVRKKQTQFDMDFQNLVVTKLHKLFSDPKSRPSPLIPEYDEQDIQLNKYIQNRERIYQMVMTCLTLVKSSMQEQPPCSDWESYRKRVQECISDCIIDFRE